MIHQSRRKGNDQEPIQTNSTSCPRHQMGKEHMQFRQHKIKKQQEQKDKKTTSSFPEDGHQNEQTESGRTMTININHNRSTTLERSVTNYSGRKPVLRAHNPGPRSAAVNKHTSYSVRVKDFELVYVSKQQTYM